MGDVLPPQSVAPAEAIEITEDGGVKKLIVREGVGEIPPLYSKCLVHYTGILASNGELFINTRDESASSEPAKLVAGRESTMKERGLHLAVATMKPGERAHLWISSDYGYGPTGHFSFPTIPPSTNLVYDIELLDYEPPVEGKEHKDMTFEERLEAADRRRIEGNDAFKAGHFEDALKKYGLSLSFLDDDLLIQLQGFHYDKAMELRLPAMLNMAACHLKLEKYHEAIVCTNQVLMHDSKNSKALYRRAVARRSLGQTDKALEDLQVAWKNSPGDTNIAKEIHAVKEELKQERMAQAKVFKGLVEKASRQGGLYDSEEEEEEGEAPWLRQQDALVSSQSWIGSVLQALCPFIFGRQKKNQ